MISSFLSCALSGLSPCLIQVEVDLSGGLPHCQIVGLPDSAVQESRDRIRAAIRNSGFDFPLKRVTINLAPADQKKEGAGFDLAMALGILASSGQIPGGTSEDFLVLGELGLNGSIRSVPGVLVMAEVCRNGGPRKLLVPFENAQEAMVFPDVQVWPVRSLQEAVLVFNGGCEPLEAKAPWQPEERRFPDLKSVKGQEHAKRAIEVAAAGNHNLLFVGPPGSGKTMLAKRLPGLLPSLTFDEALEVSKIQSVAGFLQEREGIAQSRAFRAPHASISYAGMVGGGNPVRPGELSLAHRGVLFMDEFPEFHRDVLESLRQPFEDKTVTVVRISGAVTYPADFLFVGAMNPCPCGYYGDSHRDCMCRPTERLQYHKRVSGPLLDRIDLHVEVSRIPQKEFYATAAREDSATIRKRVAAARNIQTARYGKAIANGQVELEILETKLSLADEAEEFLKQAYDKLRLSARGHGKILRVARSIADLGGSREVKLLHVAEALQYRVLDRNLYCT